MSTATSGRISAMETCQPSCSNLSRTAGPERSSRLPAAALSLMVRTAASIIASLPVGSAAVIAALSAGFFQQVHVLNFDGLVQRLGHVVDGERGGGGRGQCLHFDAGL